MQTLHKDILTFIANLKPNIGVALISGEEEVEEVAGTDQKLGNLCTVIDSNQWGRIRLSISHLQGVIVYFSFKPAWRQDMT